MVDEQRVSKQAKELVSAITELEDRYQTALDEVERLQAQESLGKSVLAGRTMFVLWNDDAPFGIYTSLEAAQLAAPKLKNAKWRLDEDLSDDYRSKGDTLNVNVWYLGDSFWAVYETFIDKQT